MVHHHKTGQDIVILIQGVRQGVAWVTLDQIVATLGHPDISSRGQCWFQSRKCGKNIAFVMNKLVVRFISPWFK